MTLYLSLTLYSCSLELLLGKMLKATQNRHHTLLLGLDTESQPYIRKKCKGFYWVNILLSCRRGLSPSADMRVYLAPCDISKPG